MKRILWLSHIVPFPLESGVILRSYNLIKELSKKHSITMIAFNQTDNCPSQDDLDTATTELSKFCSIEGVVDIPKDVSLASRITLPIKGLLPNRTYTNLWLKSQAYKDLVHRVLIENEFDVIHVDTISLAQYLPSDTRSYTVLNHHNIESLMMLRRASQEKNLLKKFYFYQEGKKLKAYEAQVCPQFDLNITCSDLDIERLSTVTSVRKCISVPNGVDTKYFSPSESVQVENRLIFTGSLAWYPNADAVRFFFNKVWNRLKDIVPNVTITIIGKSPPSWLMALSKSDKQVMVLGYVDDVRPYMDESSVYICPIKDGGGTKLKVLNALSMGMCIVADPIACEGISVENGGSVILASTPDEYVRSIADILNNESDRLRIGRQARDLAIKNYDYTEIGGLLSDSLDAAH
ncbi:glycosyltransferase [Marinimicrobium alkaliphilum]|uniref:glycosyltransferase n=1 Tax=Marinimicrobium alkaliphilum TaxID=2202654 RepID=UPI000DB9EA67|nr:glycosyltransferase [Marinimicrobium alkaliphilum]